MTKKARKDDKNDALGREIIWLLNLRITDGCVTTAFGTKTALGLGATVRRIIKESDNQYNLEES